jgi:hypothetical protein
MPTEENTYEYEPIFKGLILNILDFGQKVV